MTVRINGVVHGKTVELAEDPKLVQGQKVEVTLRTLASAEPLAPGEGIRRSAGALADDPRAEEDMEIVLRARKQERRHQVDQ